LTLKEGRVVHEMAHKPMGSKTGKRALIVRFPEDLYEILHEFCAMHEISMTAFIVARTQLGSQQWIEAGKQRVPEDSPENYVVRLNGLIELAKQIDAENRSRRPR
jgi:hypothetical protein